MGGHNNLDRLSFLEGQTCKQDFSIFHYDLFYLYCFHFRTSRSVSFGQSNCVVKREALGFPFMDENPLVPNPCPVVEDLMALHQLGPIRQYVVGGVRHRLPLDGNTRSSAAVPFLTAHLITPAHRWPTCHRHTGHGSRDHRRDGGPVVDDASTWRWCSFVIDHHAIYGVFPLRHRTPRVRTDVIAAARLRAWWYDPRTGRALQEPAPGSVDAPPRAEPLLLVATTRSSSSECRGSNRSSWGGPCVWQSLQHVARYPDAALRPLPRC